MGAAGFIPPQVWRKTNGRCWYCGCDLSAEDWSVDHLTPQALGAAIYP
jgi:5-methylcytosine-specific restriction endonuclease McrA